MVRDQRQQRYSNDDRSNNGNGKEEPNEKEKNKQT